MIKHRKTMVLLPMLKLVIMVKKLSKTPFFFLIKMIQIFFIVFVYFKPKTHNNKVKKQY
jgi:hypothetical protein